MRIIKPFTKTIKKKVNPMAKHKKHKGKKSHHKSAIVLSNPKRKKRHNPVKIKHRRRKNPATLSARGIMEQIKPIALGAVGGILISKVLSYIPIDEKYRPYAKLGVAIALPIFVKHPIAKLGALFLGTLAVRDMIAVKFPDLVAGDESAQALVGYEEYDTMMHGGQVQFGADQVSFAGVDEQHSMYDKTGF